MTKPTDKQVQAYIASCCGFSEQQIGVLMGISQQAVSRLIARFKINRQREDIDDDDIWDTFEPVSQPPITTISYANYMDCKIKQRF